MYRASFDDSNCNGNVIEYRMTAGRGIINTRQPIGNAASRNTSVPNKYRVIPQSRGSSEDCATKFSAPQVPAASCSKARITITSAQGRGNTLEFANSSRRFHSIQKNTTGTMKP